MPTPSEYVIAIDPGHRAGWARATLAENSITNLEHGVVSAKDMGVVLHTHQMEDPPRYDAIVYETWRPRPQNGSMNWIKGDQLLSAQLVGQIRLCGWVSDAKLKGYGPDRKAPFTASMPPELRARMDECHEQHDQDALMHLWGYAFENWVTDPSKITIS